VLQARLAGQPPRLRSNVERLLILARGGASGRCGDAPAEIGEMLPTTPGRAGGEHLMSLPLRDAREIFEREYLTAQVNRFGGNIRVPLSSSGWSAPPCRKLKSLGVS
jgi:two-component system nitrogen regulation response regulator NtrX